MAIGYNQVNASLRFSGRFDRELAQQAAALTVGKMVDSTWLLRASVARIVGGELVGAVQTATLESGWSVAVQASRRFIYEQIPQLYVGGAVSLAASLIGARYGQGEVSSYGAVDVRIGATAGWILFGAVIPYAAVRAFGGPVMWRAEPAGDTVAGTDRHHFQIGAGLAVRLPVGLYASLDYVPLGERSLSAEMGVRF